MPTHHYNPEEVKLEPPVLPLPGWSLIITESNQASIHHLLEQTCYFVSLP
jgi:hypothetical protein